jgi:hypothetical protein
MMAPPAVGFAPMALGVLVPTAGATQRLRRHLPAALEHAATIDNVGASTPGDEWSPQATACELPNCRISAATIVWI